MKKSESNTTKIFIVIIAMVVLIMVVIGASFAFFTAASVTGNSGANSISTTAAKYGTLIVTYPETDGTISMGTVDLPYTTRLTQPIVQGMLKFSVTAAAEANVNINYIIKWAGVDNIYNDFCQYRSTETTCSDTIGDTYVGDEIYYTLYKCSDIGYSESSITDKTVTLGAGCEAISTENAPAPYNNTDKVAQINIHTQTININQSRINYHVLVLNIKNINSVQDYNQGKRFSGALSIESVSN